MLYNINGVKIMNLKEKFIRYMTLAHRQSGLNSEEHAEFCHLEEDLIDELTIVEEQTCQKKSH